MNKWWVYGRERNSEGLSFNCEVCGERFTPLRVRREDGSRRVCSRRCAALAASRAAAVRGPYLNTGVDWRQQRQYKDAKGYLEVVVPGSDNKPAHRKVHRLVVEERLGRPLYPWELVHHRNGVKDDNRDENLEVVLRRVHLGYVNCPSCGYHFGIK